MLSAFGKKPTALGVYRSVSPFAGRHISISRLLAAALAVAAASCAAASPAASAATYDVHLCEGNSDGITTINDSVVLMSAGCDGMTQGVLDNTSQFGSTFGSSAWQITAPRGTTIQSIRARRHFSGTWASTVHDTTWTVQDSLGDTLDSFTSTRSGGTPPADTDVLYNTTGSSSVTATLQCTAPPNELCGSFGFGVSLINPVATFADNVPPAEPLLAGTLKPNSTVSGTQTVTFSTGDVGGGVHQVDLNVDGQRVASVVPSDSGCTPPYTKVVPCPANLSGTFTIDTTQFSDGQHPMGLVATDAAGTPSNSGGLGLVTVRNTPQSTAPPALGGSAVVGGQLTTTTGTWDLQPTAFNFTWLRCPATVTSPAGAASCTPILGALDAHFYAPTGDDAGHRIMVKVTARNTAAPFTGPVTAFSAPSAVVPAPHGGPPPGPDRTPPALSALSLSRTRFRAVAKGTASLLRLTSSEAAKLAILIQRALPGRQVKGAGKTVCAAVRKPVKRGRCTVYRTATTLTKSITAGHASIALTGRAGSRKLAPGSYRITLVARDAAGNASAPRRLTFTILR